MRIQVFWAMLWVSTQAATGLLFQDPVVCRFTDSKQCYVALGQRLHLPIPQEDKFRLWRYYNDTVNHRLLDYNKNINDKPTPTLTSWQFMADNKTMILSSAEKSDSGTYTLAKFNSAGKSTGTSTLQINIEARISSVKVLYSCSLPGVMKVECSADGDDLHFTWTSDFSDQLQNGNRIIELDKNQQGNITCHVENHVSRVLSSVQLRPCPGLLFQDPVVCRFTESKQCFLAVGQRLHLPMPREDQFKLRIDNNKATYYILKYNKNQNEILLAPWQFVADNNTMILSSAEKSDSGTYYLEMYSSDGSFQGTSTLQVNIEARVSSVKVWYSCSPPGVMKVDCSADGDDLHFTWTSDFSEQLQNGNRTIELDKNQQGNITCHVENHVSLVLSSVHLRPCPGLLFQDPVVCRFTESKQCFLAVGQRLHLPMPREDQFKLRIDNNKATYYILKYNKNQNEILLAPWQFVADNKTMILSSAEKSDSGTYYLEMYSSDGSFQGTSTLQVNIEARVSTVKVWYSCSPPGVMEVECSADGDDLHFTWTSDFSDQLQNGNRTIELEKNQQGNITCHVENHVSRDFSSVQLRPCPETSYNQSNKGFMVFVYVWLVEVIILLSMLGGFHIYIRLYKKTKNNLK